MPEQNGLMWVNQERVNMNKIALILLFVSSPCHQILSQDLSNFRWKNRILLLLVEDLNLAEVSVQVAEIQSKKNGIKDRKMKVFLLSKAKAFSGFNLDQEVSSSALYQEYKKTDEPFEMILIGLDGGVKKRYTGYEPVKNIFSLIDGMPMRRAVLNRKQE